MVNMIEEKWNVPQKATLEEGTEGRIDYEGASLRGRKFDDSGLRDGIVDEDKQSANADAGEGGRSLETAGAPGVEGGKETGFKKG